ncbi:hypothetical protein CFK37_04425 [Virgibacillus phasianinus]|uniref:Uncharacterized protein n=1 Tax=Virgibacillus phasianinus TaxID=2017483 RepID=A0A220U0W7_9BACI|nr:hypothetical protein CFK37_04425 [Virgibacillus phasianinus]
MPAKGDFSRATLTAVLRGLADLSLQGKESSLEKHRTQKKRVSFSRSLRIFKMLGKGEKLNF